MEHLTQMPEEGTRVLIRVNVYDNATDECADVIGTKFVEATVTRAWGNGRYASVRTEPYAARLLGAFISRTFTRNYSDLYEI